MVSLWTRLTHYFNVLVWEAPLPTSTKRRLSALVYRNPPIGAARVIETLAVLSGAGIQAWVFGGWGIDALTGRQTRPHRDLDLMISHLDLDAALLALGGLGYREWFRNPCDMRIGGFEVPGEVVVVRDASMRVVDLHPVALPDPHPSLASGTIAGQSVRCLSASQQIQTRSGHTSRWPPAQRRARRDMRNAERLLDGSSSSRSASNPR